MRCPVWLEQITSTLWCDVLTIHLVLGNKSLETTLRLMRDGYSKYAC